MVDLNTDMLINLKNQIDLSELVGCDDFCNIIDSPTRVTSTTSSLIGLFITSANTDLISAGALLSNVCDHFPVFVFKTKLSHYLP